MKQHDKAKVTSCACGCGKHTKGGRFLPGHDSKLRSKLIQAALGGDKNAARALTRHGWPRRLAKRRQKIVAAAAAKQ